MPPFLRQILYITAHLIVNTRHLAKSVLGPQAVWPIRGGQMLQLTNQRHETVLPWAAHNVTGARHLINGITWEKKRKNNFQVIFCVWTISISHHRDYWTSLWDKMRIYPAPRNIKYISELCYPWHNSFSERKREQSHLLTKLETSWRFCVAASAVKSDFWNSNFCKEKKVSLWV